MGSRIGAPGDAVDIEAAAELAARFEVGEGRELAAVAGAGIVPGERPAEPRVHADVEVHHDEDRRLQPVGEIEGIRGHGEARGRVLGDEEDVFGVAVPRVGAGQDVGLLGPGGRPVETAHRGLEPAAQLRLGAVHGEADVVRGGDVGAGVAGDAELAGEDGPDVAVEAVFGFVPGLLGVEAGLDLGRKRGERRERGRCGTCWRVSSETSSS